MLCPVTAHRMQLCCFPAVLLCPLPSCSISAEVGKPTGSWTRPGPPMLVLGQGRRAGQGSPSLRSAAGDIPPPHCRVCLAPCWAEPQLLPGLVAGRGRWCRGSLGTGAACSFPAPSLIPPCGSPQQLVLSMVRGGWDLRQRFPMEQGARGVPSVPESRYCSRAGRAARACPAGATPAQHRSCLVFVGAGAESSKPECSPLPSLGV